jgi:hypothetical protein
MSGAEPEVASFFAVIEKLPCEIRGWVVGARGYCSGAS